VGAGAGATVAVFACAEAVDGAAISAPNIAALTTATIRMLVMSVLRSGPGAPRGAPLLDG